MFLPGDRSRAARIAEGFSDVVVVDNPRGLTAHLGRIEQDGHCVDALAISSGMGTASTEIVLRELLCIGARRVVRVGSCGAMDPNIRPGQVAIVTGAVRDELATRHIAPLGIKL